MEISNLLAGESAHIQAKEAEALAILTALADPARQMIDGAEREFGHVIPRSELGWSVSATAHEMFNKGRKDATRFLFDAYATTVFRLVPDAETFVSLLGPIRVRVKAKLSVIDQHEAELCRLEWAKLAWEREKPIAIRKAWRRWRAFWIRSAPLRGDRRPESDPKIIEQAGATAPTVEESTPGVPTAAGSGDDEPPAHNAGKAAQAAPQPPMVLADRSAWLSGRLLKRGWSTSYPSKWGGPDRKTIEKILRGEAVTNSVLLKLADALSKVGEAVNVLDIPKT